MRTLYLLISFLTVALCAQAQTGKISGTIKTSDGKAAAMVNVGLKGTQKGTISDSEGHYEISNIKEGTYTLVASFVGMQRKEMQVVVAGNKTTVVPEFVLEESQERLKEIVVEGLNEDNFKVDAPSQSLRLQGPLIEAPQNIQVITSDVIRNQQSIDMLESVSRNVSGVQMIEHWGNFARINMRGFKIPAFRNGMNVDLPWGPLTEDMSMVERIEFVKGPAGFMLSSGEPGGLYNVVTKKPELNHRNEVTFTTGSFNTLRSTLDLGGKLKKDGSLLYRFNLMGLTKGSHRDYEFNNRYTIAPSVRYNIGEETSLTAAYIYQYSQMSVAGAAYVFSPNGFADLPGDFTFGEPNIDPTNIDEHNIFLTLNHKIASGWDLTAQLSYLRYNQEGSSLWVDSVQANGDLYRTMNSFDAHNDSKLGQVFLTGKFNTGLVSHSVLTGLDLGHKDFYADWWQGGRIGGIFNVYNPVYGVPAASLPQINRQQSLRQRSTAGSYPASSGQRYASIYVQDQLGFFNDKVRLTLAGRYTSYSGWSYGNTTDDQVLTPRLGLSVTVAKNTSVYGLYDQSFIPQAGQDKEGNVFVPVRANNLEAGIKREWAGGRWNSTLAVYQITKENIIVGDPENVNFSIQLGEVQSKGVEFDVQGEIVDGLKLILNYANTDVEITEDTNEARVGTRVAGHARHMTNGWLQYQFQNTAIKGLGLSLGYQYQADRSSWSWSADNESVLPDYFRLDGAISWQNDDFNVGLNVYNLLNDYLYSGSAYSSFYYWQSEPGTNFRLSLGYKF